MRDLGQVIEIGLAFPRQVELHLIGEAEEIEFPPKEDAALFVGIFDHIRLEQEIDEFIGR